MSSPDADNNTSESAAWNTTRVFLGSEPARAVERLLPRSASIGSTRVAIHAGAMPKAIPAINETPKANSSTGMEGDASMGMPAMSPTLGNASCKIRRAPANAITRPAAPPRNESKMLSVRACRTTRVARAPRAMLKDICLRRSRLRTSIRLATLAQTIKSTNPVTIIRIRSQWSYSSRIALMPAPPGLRNRVCSGNFARSLALISPQCESSHCLISTRISASMDSGALPGRVRPINSSQ